MHITGTTIAFLVLAVTATFSGLGVILFRNAVYSALSLILNLFSLALFFLVLNSLFLAVVQVLIYTGAIMVLFLFVVTMLAPDPSDTTEQRDPIRWQKGAAAGLGVILAGGVSYLLFITTLSPAAKASAEDSLSRMIDKVGSIQAFGLALFHGFLFPFEVTSVLLVVGLIGALVLGRRASRD
ncbi:MAG TPA: NADH-quinone oxidoreductase subunit J [Ktedonobacterales bacterium]|jgi:NADH-quinone oxidoreductase subunit J